MSAETSQLILSEQLKGEVEGWVQQGWPGLTKTTYELFHYWFDRDENIPERFHPCQQRAIETIVYCHEILQIKTLQELFMKVAPEALVNSQAILDEVQSVNFPKYCFKMATGTGKTWVLLALLIWQYFNYENKEKPPKASGDSKNWYTQHFLTVAPGHEVLNRLLDAVKGRRNSDSDIRDYSTADIMSSLFMPESWRQKFNIQILEPSDVRPNTNPPEGPFIFLTNWQQFVLKKDVDSLWEKLTGDEIGEQPRGEYLIEFLSEYPDLVILNDEAHHVHGSKNVNNEEMVWRKFINTLYDTLSKKHGDNKGLFVQYDFSATPFFGSGTKKTFFQHIIYDYNLINAMQAMLVKQLFLEERMAIAYEQLDFRAKRKDPESGKKKGDIIGLSEGQKVLLDIGRRKLENLTEEFRQKGIDKKPVMMVLCEETEVASLVKQHFANIADNNGVSYDEKKVLEIHTELKNTELEQARRMLDKIDDNSNPLNVVISVLMLREGFDRKNISVAVVLRATEADLLLEQIVGRGLRLMFPKRDNEAIWQSKVEAVEDIRRNKTPNSSFDFLFIVEHPRFKRFYETLRNKGYLIAGGESPQRNTGDLIPIDAMPVRILDYDIAWPVQIFEQGSFPDITKIDVSKIPRYSMLSSFEALRDSLGKLIIQEIHYETGKRTKTWKLENRYFSYEYFLNRASHAVAEAGKTTILSGHLAELAQIIDEYVYNYMFGQKIDFSDNRNAQVLNYVVVFDFVVDEIRKAILRELGELHYQQTGRWRKVSDVTRLMLREKTSIETRKCIYSRQGFSAKGGGFESDFMKNVLENSAEVLAFAKPERRHALLIPYRDEYGILRDYEVDFIVKTQDSMYLVETKADKDLGDATVQLKAKAAHSWCKNASTVPPPDEIKQPQNLEYLLLSEGLYKENSGLGFEAFIPLCRLQRDRAIEQFDFSFANKIKQTNLN